MNLGLNNKVAIITGSSKGIGLAIARGLAAEGVHLALCARDGQQLAACAQEIRAQFGVKAVALPADISRAAEIEKIVKEAIAVLGGVDILINNAGIGSNETVMT